MAEMDAFSPSEQAYAWGHGDAYFGADLPVRFPKYEPPKITGASLAEKIRQRAAEKRNIKREVPKPSFDACAIEFADGPSDSDDDLVVVARAPPAKENPIAARAAILGLLRKHVSQKKQRERENLDDYRRADEEDFTDDEGEEEEEEEEQEQLEARESSPSALHLSTEKQPMSPLRSPFASDDEDDTENRAADKDEQTEVGDMDRQSELLSDMAEESNDGESNDDEERDSEEADAHDADADVQRKERRIESDGSDTEDDDDETLHRTKKVIGPTGTLLRDDDSDVEEDQDFAAYHAEIAALLEEPEERPSTPPAKKASSQPRVADVDAVREDGLHVDDAVDEVEHSDVEYDVDRENSDDEAEGGFLDMEAEDVDAHGDGEDEEEGDDDYRNLDYVVSDHKMQEEKPDLHARILRDMQNDDDDEVLQRVSAIAAGMARQKRGAVEISDDEDEDAIQRIRRRRAEKTRAQQAIEQMERRAFGFTAVPVDDSANDTEFFADTGSALQWHLPTRHREQLASMSEEIFSMDTQSSILSADDASQSIQHLVRRTSSISATVQTCDFVRKNSFLNKNRDKLQKMSQVGTGSDGRSMFVFRNAEPVAATASAPNPAPSSQGFAPSGPRPMLHRSTSLLAVLENSNDFSRKITNV